MADVESIMPIVSALGTSVITNTLKDKAKGNDLFQVTVVLIVGYAMTRSLALCAVGFFVWFLLNEN